MKSLFGTSKTILFEVDLIFFIVTLLTTGYVNLVLGKTQTIRSFFPNDATLWHLYKGDTIHSGVVFGILYYIVAPMVYVIERRRLRDKQISERRRQLSALRLASGVLSCTMIAVMIVEFGKGYVGALRPSFARSCLVPDEPPYTLSTSSKSNEIKGIYRTDAECPSKNRKALHDGRRSFPSGHAALAISGVVYGQLTLVRYIRSAEMSDMTAAGLCGVGWLWFMFAAWVCASRVHDSAHHVADVAVGSIVGFWCGAMHFWFVTGRNETAEKADLAVQARMQSLKEESKLQ